jgi:hypothetical protein
LSLTGARAQVRNTMMVSDLKDKIWQMTDIVPSRQLSRHAA